MISISNLTAREELRLNGTIPIDKIEDLLNSEERLKALEDIDAHIEEAMAQYPAEDFLEGIKGRLLDLHKRLRGDNKETLAGIIEALDDLAQCTFNAADYGRSELHAALKTIQEK